MKHSSLLIIVLCILMLSAGGCNSDECFDNQNALPLAGFYDYQEPAKTVSIDSIMIYGFMAPQDSVLWDGKKATDEVYLPFKLTSDTTKYVFKYLQKELARYNITDTVTFIYDREPRLVSAACGVSYLFTLKDIKHTQMLIDSVACPSGTITNAPVQNLKIFFRIDHSNDN